MKKFFLFVAAAAMSIAASATDIWTGPKHVSWAEGGVQIAANQFATAQPGQKIVISFAEGATDGIEFKVMNAHFDHLAGSREAAWIKDVTFFEQFLTQAAVDSLKLYGLEIIGANFTATKVELNDGKNLKEGLSVWTGFFWAAGYQTLELYRDGYCNVDFSKVSAIRFYSEAKGSEYIINLLENWDAEGKIADQTSMTDGNGYKELPLTDGLRNRLVAASHWMVQFSNEALDPFNVTDIVLVLKGDTTAIDNTVVETKAVKIIENGQVVIIKNGIRYNALGAQL